PRPIDLVADAPVFDAVWLFKPVLAAQVGEGGVPRAVAILDPVARLAHIPIATVDSDVRFRADFAAEGDELVRTEGVWLHRAPRKVGARHSFLDRADAIAPAIAGDEISARIANHRDAQAPQRIQHVGAQPVGVGEGRAGVVNAAVDAAAQVLGKSAEDVAVDGSQRAVNVDLNMVHRNTLTAAETGHRQNSKLVRNRIQLIVCNSYAHSIGK